MSGGVFGARQRRRKKMHILYWEVLPSKERGSVGLRRSEVMNKALLTKLAWHLLHVEDAIWSRLVRSKYGLSLIEPPIFRHKSSASVVWRGLVWASEPLRSAVRWEVRNEKRILFWIDHWLDDMLGVGLTAGYMMICLVLLIIRWLLSRISREQLLIVGRKALDGGGDCWVILFSPLYFCCFRMPL